MRKLINLRAFILAVLFAVASLASAGTVFADSLGSSTVYPVSGYGEGVVEDKTGNIWVSNINGHGVIKMSKSGSVTSYTSNTLPWGTAKTIAVDDSNSIWFFDGSNIARIGQDGSSNVYTVPATYTGSSFPYLTYGPDGNIWFVASDGSTVHNYIGRMSTSGSFLSFYPINGRPTNILLPDKNNNAVWYSSYPFTSGGGTLDQTIINKLLPDGTQTAYTAPSGLGRAASLTWGPDGNIWYAGSSKIGNMTTSGSFTYYDLFLSSTKSMMQLTSGLDGYLWAMLRDGTAERVSTSGVGTNYSVFPSGTSSPSLKGMTAGRDGNIWFSGRVGLDPKVVRFGTGYTDDDEDGLQYAQEIAQGTTDNNSDYDDDGLSDYVESTSYGARNSVFCDTSVTTCEYPSPTSKDIYIENDWMVKPGVDGYSTQLSSTQVSSLQSSFSSKGISLHVDTGQLGGGNEITYDSTIYFAPHSGFIDFYDYKLGGDGISANLSTLRREIFHYLITGGEYLDTPGSSGASWAGDDDLFISYGRLKENPSVFGYSSIDTAISGSVMHELGHNLCLTGEHGGTPAYDGQPSSCRFAGVDAEYGSTYPSVMNYDYQVFQVDYSMGTGGAPNDHNDWSTIRLSDFTHSQTGDISHGVGAVRNPSLKQQLLKRNPKKERPIMEPAPKKFEVTHHGQ